MFYKKVYLAPSDVHGIWLFAGEAIKKWETVWIPSEVFTLHIPQDAYDALPKEDQEVIAHYGYFHKEQKIWHFSAENARYINHSVQPTIGIVVENDWVMALVDIEPGQELTQNYQDFEELRDL